MIFLNKNTNNLVALTLSEKTTLTGTSSVDFSYLFNFTSDDNQQQYYFTAIDTSTNPVRFNQFAVIETGVTSVNLALGAINLPTLGYYHYKIFQQTGTTNVYLSGVTGDYIESGKMLLTGGSMSIVTYQYTGSSSLYVYNN